jgi:hypothetical protein
MTCTTARSTRIAYVSLIAAVLTAGICGDAVAKVHRGRLHVRSHTFESHAQLIAQQPTSLGPMRYYGGPKSPMWRGPAAN